MQMIMVAIANAVIGFIVGACGLSGFLLPMFYAAYTDFSVGEYLAISYWAFILSGPVALIGFKEGFGRERRTLGWLCAASAVGAVFGVRLNSLISPENVKLILYIVVLLAGISIIVMGRKNKKAREEKRSPLLDSKAGMFAFGLVTSTVCAIGGSGGPILVMPLLTTMGMEVHVAMAVGLIDSLFVSVPAFVGYVRGVEIRGLIVYMAVICVTYGGAALLGRRFSSKIPSAPLKRAVGIFSVIIAVYMLAGLVI